MNTKKLISDEHGTIEYKELPVEDGDIIVVRAGISQGAIDILSDMLGSTGREHSIIVAVNKMSDIRALSQEQMANHGWYRNDRLRVVKKFLESKILEEHGRPDSLEQVYNGIYYMVTGKYMEITNDE